MPTKIGSEFLVNTTTTARQTAGSVTVLSNGNFVVSWYDTSNVGADTSVSAIRAQVFEPDGDKVGGEFQVNTTATNSQGHDRLSALANGNFVATWSDESASGGDTSLQAVRAQIFEPDGDKVGSEFLVPTTTSSDQQWGRIALLTNGNFVVTWDDYSQSTGDTSSAAVRGQIFEPDGDKVGSEFVVNTTTSQSQTHSVPAALAGGGFVVVWNDLSQTGSDTNGYAIRAQRFDSSGSKVGSELLVNTTTSSDQQEAYVVGLSGGGFVVVWEDLSSGAWSRDLKAQLFNSSGTKVGSEFTVNTTTADAQVHVEVAALPTGGFVAVWSDAHFDTSISEFDTSEIRGQEFDSAGAKVGSEFLVNTTTSGIQLNPHIDVFDDGRFVVTWRDNNNLGPTTSQWDSRAQVFIADNAVTPPELVSTSPADNATGVAAGGNITLTFDEDVTAGTGSITIVNTDDPGDVRVLAVDGAQVAFAGETVTLNPTNDLRTGERYHVLIDGTAIKDLLGTPFAGIADATTYNFSTGPTQPTVVSGGGGDDTHLGTEGSDTLSGGTGMDTIFGGAGADSLDGGSGDDSVSGGPGNDTVLGGSGDDSLDGGAGNDSADGGSGSDSMIGGSGNDTLRGGLGDDVIDGGNGTDSIDGGNGADSIQGGEGDDSIVGGAGDDTINSGAGQDTISADAGDDVVDGDAGNDSISGGLGSDTLSGSDGSDTLDGGIGDDSLHGGTGSDEIVGGSGSDTLNGGADSDQLVGGAGSDVFVFDAATGADSIDDYVRGVDTVNIAAYSFADFAAVLAVTTFSGGNSIIDLGGGNSIELAGVALSGADADSFIL